MQIINSETSVDLTKASEELFKNLIDTADIIISKGQGNFETMNEYDRPIAFLFLAKCPAVTDLIKVEMKSIQVRLINLQ